ncbi:MAG: rhodanese-like domain-containing protein [Acidimicrobiia bacterium]
MGKSYRDLVLEAKAGLRLVYPDELKARIDSGEQMVVIDVREPDEWARGTIPGAHPVARGVLELQVDGKLPLDATVVLYCAGGGRSALAGRSLQEMGFSAVENLEGGFDAWARAGHPVARP